MFQSIILVSTGAAIGASLRWGLGLWLNSLFSTLAFGTLVANFIGCFLMGILVSAFWLFPQFSPEWRLFLVTGFLGALTTFSSFSGEVIELFFKEEWGIDNRCFSCARRSDKCDRLTRFHDKIDIL